MGFWALFSSLQAVDSWNNPKIAIKPVPSFSVLGNTSGCPALALRCLLVTLSRASCKERQDAAYIVCSQSEHSLCMSALPAKAGWAAGLLNIDSTTVLIVAQWWRCQQHLSALLLRSYFAHCVDFAMLPSDTNYCHSWVWIMLHTLGNPCWALSTSTLSLGPFFVICMARASLCAEEISALPAIFMENFPIHN